MTTVVFAGPTIERNDVTSICNCRCLPPAARGDVYRASLAKPTAIGIIDGYFQGVLSVWHKEILWAISQGIHVFGSSSMGALRAAELQPYGMVGVGRIFESFACGELEDDDEVAVLHGPAELGFPGLSEPMVNIRATIESATGAGIIDRDASDAVIAKAKQLHFHDRNWKTLLHTAAGSATTEQTKALQDWLPSGQVDLKRDDAVEMLAALQEFVAARPAPKESNFAFEWTYQWDMVTREVVKKSAFVPRDANDVSYDDLLDELRVDPNVYSRLSKAALLRLLALDGFSGDALDLDRPELKARENRFRIQNGLMTKRALDDWLEANRLDAQGLDRLHEREALIEALCAEAGRALEPYLLDALHASGEFAAFHARAMAKKVALEGAGRAEARPSDLGKRNIELVAWYFEVHLDQEIPDDLDDYIAKLGFPDIDYFRRFIAREYLYVTNS